MPLTARENDVAPASRDSSPASSPGNSSTHEEASARQQAVALEVPVAVNGARAGVIGEKSEYFSVSTRTVLVFGQGAVIRLNEGVAPGQMLRLINEKTKKEVACQVVKSKNDRTVNGYVELKFTEAMPGFWGMRFPGESAAPAGESTKAIPSAERQHEATKVATVEASALDEDFKTELKIDDHSGSKAELLAPANDPATEALKIQNSRLQEQLSSLLFADAPQTAQSSSASSSAQETEFAGAAAKLLDMASVETVPKDIASKKESAPLAASLKSALPPEKSTLKVEEVKVPAWLEPLARNVAAQSSGSEASKKEASPKLSDAAFESQEALATPPRRETPAVKPAAAVFGRTLLDGGASRVRSSRGGNKGLLAAVIAAVMLVSAAGVTWYLRQSASSAEDRVSASALPLNSTAASKALAAEPAPPQAEAQTQSDASAPASQTTVPANPVSRPSSDAAFSVASSAEVRPQPAVISERIPKANAAVDTSAKVALKLPAVEAQPEPSKPTLGAVRLAKPKVGRSSRNLSGGVPEPELDGTSDALLPSDGAFEGLVGAQPAAPAAPVPVGGDVKTARMISSVPPVYPPMAKTQRVSGDVRIDALIDATGRVSSMKVVSGPSLLHQAAMEALRQWKYQPATLDGKPVAMHLTVTIQFRLQ